MLEDRSYMRESSGHDRSASMTLFWVIVGTFFFQLADGVYNGGRITSLLTLSPAGIRHGFLWQFVTFQFLHANFIHLLFNMLALWSFGRGLEQILGTRRFLQVYFAAGIIGGICQVILGFLLPNVWGGAVVGASAGICGMIAVYATIDPHSTIYFWMIPLRAQVFLIGLVALSIFGIVVPFDRSAHAAHLGGILTGIAFVRWFMNNDWAFSKLDFRRKQEPRPRELVTTPAGSFWKKSKSSPGAEDLPSGDFISKEVDPILDKISAHGIQSLTESERRILEAARAKMSRR
jgi:membrane associated rhomboid family serine protease